MAPMTMAYVGRFAPSPTGPLHFGSLVAGLASYLDAKANNGQWLIRMEDIDPPREQAGSIKEILLCLEAHHLYWEGDVLYQSTRGDAYFEMLDKLERQALSYRCICSRQQLKEQRIYSGHCRTSDHGTETFSAIRLNISKALHHLNSDPLIEFDDSVQGVQTQNLLDDVGDFIIHRKDGLFAYQLAVVVDDIFQGITHIIRGADLLSSTPRQILLFQLLGEHTPIFSHIPLALNEQGQKLCKQHHAPALNNNLASTNLFQALQFLNQQPPEALAHEHPTTLLKWAIDHWQSQKMH